MLTKLIVNILSGDINIINESAETLLQAIREAGLEVKNTEKAKYILMSRHQNAGQIHSLLIASKSFENVEKFKYLGTISNKNCIHEEIKSRLNLGNACYHSVQNFTCCFV